MALDGIIRSVVGIANTVTDSLQVTVTLQQWLGSDGFGASSYDDPISLKCLLDVRQQERRLPSGQMVMTKAVLQFLEPIAPNGAAGRLEPIDPRDIITLPDGTTGPIVDMEGMVDPTTNRPYFQRVWLGMPGIASAMSTSMGGRF